MAQNLPQILSDLENGKGVFVGLPRFIREDGSVADVQEREIVPASPIGKAAYDGFAGFATVTDVLAVVENFNEQLGNIALALDDIETALEVIIG